MPNNSTVWKFIMAYVCVKFGVQYLLAIPMDCHCRPVITLFEIQSFLGENF